MSAESFGKLPNPDKQPGTESGVEASGLVHIRDSVDPDTGKPLMRSPQANGDGKYTYYYQGLNGKPHKWFKAKEDGETPESIAQINLLAEEEHLDALRPKLRN